LKVSPERFTVTVAFSALDAYFGDDHGRTFLDCWPDELASYGRGVARRRRRDSSLERELAMAVAEGRAVERLLAEVQATDAPLTAEDGLKKLNEARAEMLARGRSVLARAMKAARGVTVQESRAMDEIHAEVSRLDTESALAMRRVESACQWLRS
jgi:hypothetical protein